MNGTSWKLNEAGVLYLRRDEWEIMSHHASILGWTNPGDDRINGADVVLLRASFRDSVPAEYIEVEIPSESAYQFAGCLDRGNHLMSAKEEGERNEFREHFEMLCENFHHCISDGFMDEGIEFGALCNSGKVLRLAEFSREGGFLVCRCSEVVARLELPSASDGVISF